MKNKGFTLVELIAVIVLIVLASTLIVVNMTGVQSDNIEVEIKKYKERVTAAGCQYIDMGKELVLSSGNNCTASNSITSRDACKSSGCYVCLETLINEGLIDSDLVNPSTNKKAIDEKTAIRVHVYWKSVGSKKQKVCEFAS